MTQDFKNKLIASMNKGAWGKENFLDAMPLIDEYVKEQLENQRATFCLISEKDRSFEDWVNKNFEKQGNCFVNKINETVTYSQDALIDIHDFYCDRFIVN